MGGKTRAGTRKDMIKFGQGRSPVRLSNARAAEAEAVENDVHFETGKPVEFSFARNTGSSPNFGATYQQDIEPAGRYLIHDPNPELEPLKGWEKGKVKFENPLVLKANSKEDRPNYNENSWKAELSRKFNNKTGAALSKAIKKAGHDGIVTINGKNETGEIVDLRNLRAAESESYEPVWKMSPEEFHAATLNREYGSPMSMFMAEAVSDAQLEKPEKEMVKLQKLGNHGVINFAAEHVGDLIQRMTNPVYSSNAGYEPMKEKVDKMLPLLASKYGFEREMNENLKSNAKEMGIPEEKLRQDVYDALDKYADAHRGVPVFNEVQRHARDAAVSLGERRFGDTVKHLRYLKDLLDQGEEKWTAEANKVDRDAVIEWANKNKNIRAAESEDHSPVAGNGPVTGKPVREHDSAPINLDDWREVNMNHEAIIDAIAKIREEGGLSTLVINERQKANTNKLFAGQPIAEYLYRLMSNSGEEVRRNQTILDGLNKVHKDYPGAKQDILDGLENGIKRGLTFNEAGAIICYSGDVYDQVNAATRDLTTHLERYLANQTVENKANLQNKINEHSHLFPIMRYMTDAIAKLSGENMMISRGASRRHATKAIEEGSYYFEPQYQSSSRFDNRSSSYISHPDQLIMVTDKGADISDISIYKNEEREVLLPPGLLFHNDFSAKDVPLDNRGHKRNIYASRQVNSGGVPNDHRSATQMITEEVSKLQGEPLTLDQVVQKMPKKIKDKMDLPVDDKTPVTKKD